MCLKRIVAVIQNITATPELGFEIALFTKENWNLDILDRPQS